MTGGALVRRKSRARGLTAAFTLAAAGLCAETAPANMSVPPALQQACEDSHPTEAIAACNRILSLGEIPRYIRRDALYNRAVGLNALGDSARARADAEALAAMSRGADERAQAEALLGRILAQADQLEPALAALSEALALKADDTNSRALRGEILDRLGRDDEALKDLSKVVSDRRDQAGPYLDLGRFYFHRSDYRTAERNFDHAVANEPRSALLYYWRGMARLKLGQAEDAAADFDAAVNLHGRFPAALRRRAELYEAVGDAARAMETFAHAAAGPAADPDVAAARDWIASHKPIQTTSSTQASAADAQRRGPRGFIDAAANDAIWLLAPDASRGKSEGH